jgi:preprotein translocase subunit SecG
LVIRTLTTPQKALLAGAAKTAAEQVANSSKKMSMATACSESMRARVVEEILTASDVFLTVLWLLVSVALCQYLVSV